MSGFFSFVGIYHIVFTNSYRQDATEPKENEEALVEDFKSGFVLFVLGTDCRIKLAFQKKLFKSILLTLQ